jgi:hypothetical protein
MARPKAKPRISPEEARAFVKRWEAVNEYELRELRSTPIELKLRQLSAMMTLARRLGWNDVLAAEEETARRRWQQLRQAYRA